MAHEKIFVPVLRTLADDEAAQAIVNDTLYCLAIREYDAGAGDRAPGGVTINNAAETVKTAFGECG